MSSRTSKFKKSQKRKLIARELYTLRQQNQGLVQLINKSTVDLQNAAKAKQESDRFAARAVPALQKAVIFSQLAFHDEVKDFLDDRFELAINDETAVPMLLKKGDRTPDQEVLSEGGWTVMSIFEAYEKEAEEDQDDLDQYIAERGLEAPEAEQALVDSTKEGQADLAALSEDQTPKDEDVAD